MTKQQPEALRLADALPYGYEIAREELRRQHSRIAELEAELAAAKAAPAAQPVARTPLSDEQIEDAFIAAGGRWADDSYWVIEDADLHPFVRGITQEEQG